MYGLISEDYLMHHGVKGMKWGVRHDPERKGRKKGKSEQNKKKRGLSPKAKKYIKVGATVAGAALVAYGAYKCSDIIRYNIALNRVSTVSIPSPLDKKPVSSLRDAWVYKKVQEPKVQFDPEVLKNVVNNGQSGKTIDQIDKSLLQSINHGVNGAFTNNPARNMNCGSCSISYIMNSLFGVKCSAIEDYKMNYGHENNKIMMPIHGKTMNQLLSSFRGVDRTSYVDNEIKPTVSKALKKVSNGSTGILMVTDGFSSHFLNYEKAKNGSVTLIDTQNNLIGDSAWNIFADVDVREIADFSKAKIHTNTSMLSRIIMH